MSPCRKADCCRFCSVAVQCSRLFIQVTFQTLFNHPGPRTCPSILCTCVLDVCLRNLDTLLEHPSGRVSRQDGRWSGLDKSAPDLVVGNRLATAQNKTVKIPTTAQRSGTSRSRRKRRSRRMTQSIKYMYVSTNVMYKCIHQINDIIAYVHTH